MPGCVLRAGGDDFAVDAFLRESPFEPCAVWHRGEPRSPRRPEPRDSSGFNLVVSDAPGDRLDEQIDDALRFLKANREEIRRLVSCVEAAGLCLDFGCNFPYRRTPASFHRLPTELIRECADLGVEIEISVYATSRESDESE